LVIDSYKNNNIDLIVAKLSDCIKFSQIDNLKLKEIIIYYDKYVCLIRPFEYGFLLIILNENGNIGKAKLELNRIGEKI